MTRKFFTLVELVVSLGVLIMILLLATITLSLATRTWYSITEYDKKLKDFHNIDKVANISFRNIVPFRWRDSNNKEKIIFSGESDKIHFAYLHRVNNPNDGGIRFLRLFVQEGILIAEYCSTPFLAESDSKISINREVIAKDVLSVNFIYADIRNEKLEWYDNWDIEQMKNIPLAIHMEIHFKDNTRKAWLRRTAGNSQFYEWGRRLKVK